jgi:hypothetical protein
MAPSSTFWADQNLEPKRSFRFLLDIGGTNTNETIASYYVKTAKIPTFQMESTVEVKYIQHTFKYPGRVKWQPIDVTIIDPATPDASAIIMNIMSAAGYVIPDNPIDAQESLSKAKSNAAMGTVYLRQIGAEIDEVLSEWKLTNAFLTNVDFGQLSYDSDEILNYTLTIDYDYATLRSATTKVDKRVGH